MAKQPTTTPALPEVPRTLTAALRVADYYGSDPFSEDGSDERDVLGSALAIVTSRFRKANKAERRTAAELAEARRLIEAYDRIANATGNDWLAVAARTEAEQ